jgi:hypothetical protein
LQRRDDKNQNPFPMGVEHFLYVIFNFLIGKAMMNAPHLWNLHEEFLTDID